MKIYAAIITAVCFMYGCKTSKPSATTNTPLQETYWKLFEVMGKPVTTPADAKQVHLKFRKESNRLEGFAGCNTLMGQYIHTAHKKISFDAGSTRMMCEGERMETENSLITVLGMADSYLIKGDTLQLLKAKMAPLAKFKAEYFN